MVSSINYEKQSGVPDYNWIIVNGICYNVLSN